MVASAVSRGLSDCFTAYQAFTEELKVKFMLSLYAKKKLCKPEADWRVGLFRRMFEGTAA